MKRAEKEKMERVGKGKDERGGRDEMEKRIGQEREGGEKDER